MQIIECPRDAMQGIKKFIPTKKKIEYINQLLKVGFDTIDVGSFVSSKLIPQLRDTDEVISSLDINDSLSKLLVIVANVKGANIASKFDNISYLGFPLSVSEEFQLNNTNKNIDESLNTIEEIQNICIRNNKKLVIYLSMAFGNPYKEKWHPDIVANLTYKLNKLNIKTIAMSDTVGVSEPVSIELLFKTLIAEYPLINFGAHFHTTIDKWQEKIDCAYNSGCRRFDSAIKGYGGCPMAKNQLVGNMPTEKLVSHFQNHININKEEFYKSIQLVDSVFNC